MAFFTHFFLRIGTVVSFAFLIFSSPVLSQDNDILLQTVKQIEARLDVRIGVAIFDEETGEHWQYRADERFIMASTFKTLACAMLLYRIDRGEEKPDRVIQFDFDELVNYSPITRKHTSAGMSLLELCAATMTVSDNSAANFVLRAIGGPKALTAFLHSIGDEVTRLDRWEPELNEGKPGDVRDMTTPNAMVRTLKALVLGDVLSVESRRQLTEWLIGNKVSKRLLRAGVPDDWVVADRSGAGGNGTRADTGVMWPPGQEPIVVAVYITDTEASFEDRNLAIAEIGRAIVASVTQKQSLALFEKYVGNSYRGF